MQGGRSSKGGEPSGGGGGGRWGADDGGRPAVGPPRRVGGGKGADGGGERRDPDYDRSGFGPGRGGGGGPGGGGGGGGGSPPWRPGLGSAGAAAGGGGGKGPRRDGPGGGGGYSGGGGGGYSGGGGGGGYSGGGGGGSGGSGFRGGGPTSSRADGAGSWRGGGGGDDRDGGRSANGFGASALGDTWRGSRGGQEERPAVGGRRDEDWGRRKGPDDGGKGGKGGGASKGGKSSWETEYDRGYPPSGKGGGKKGGDWDPDYDRGYPPSGKGGGKNGKSGNDDWDPDYDRGMGKGSTKGGGRKGRPDDGDFDRGKGGKRGKGDNGSKGDHEPSTGKGGKAGKGGKDSKGGKDGKGSKGGKNGKAHDDSDDDYDRTVSKGGGKKGAKNGAASHDPPADNQPAPRVGERSGGGSGAVTGKHLSDRKFQDLKISPQTKRAFTEGFKYELMTTVQAATIDPMLAGRDVVARAKTGTGKTLAFLVPIVENIHEWPSGVGGPFSAIILSPTRELAAQISEEAAVLLRFHPKLGVACFYGGVNIKGNHKLLNDSPVDILVATPGRLQDHLDNTRGFSDRCSKLSFLCLDEADQLLDMGFRDAIVRIIRYMPPAGQRQGALFSATFPKSVQEVAKLALKPDHDWLDTVRPDEEVTPDQIDQSVCVTDIEGMAEMLWKAVHFEMNRLPKEYKIMVFFTTARLTQLFSEVFQASKVPVHEVHSRKSQTHRNRCAEEFRSSRSGIIFSSDVLARGLDYPDVSAVIQVGVPSARDQYIHRLGRTGRAGKSGRCILLLHDFEEYFLKSLRDLPLKRLQVATAFQGAPAAPDSLWYPKDQKTCAQAYQAWLGYYNSCKGLGWSKEHLVREATRFAASIGAIWDGLPPPILKKTAGMMGLKGVPGLNIQSSVNYGD